MSRRERAKKISAALKKLFPRPVTALHYRHPWELVFAVMMSAQTTDKQVNKVTAELFKKYPSLESFATAELPKLQHDLRSIGLFRNKAKNIHKTAGLLLKNHQGNIPATMAELIGLPGIGRKTANIILSTIHGQHHGIAVDTHVIRLSRLFGLTRHRDPTKIERDLMKLFPQPEWSTTSLAFIDYGRAYCSARCQHRLCPLRDLIPNHGVGRTGSGK